MWLRYSTGNSGTGAGLAQGWWEEASLTPCFPSSRQPLCQLGAQFRCPVVFKQEILVQVIGTVELVGDIEVAPAAGNRSHVVGGG